MLKSVNANLETKIAKNDAAVPPALPGAKRRRLPADVRRKEILQAAREVFVRDGLQGARTREIAMVAKVNIATLFHYFNSKEELFDAAVLQPLEAFVDIQLQTGARFPKLTVEERQALSKNSTEAEARLMMETFPLLVAALFSSRERGSEFYREKLYPRLLSLGEAGRRAFPEAAALGFDFDFLAMCAFSINFMLAMDAHYRGVTLDVEVLASKVNALLVADVLPPMPRPAPAAPAVPAKTRGTRKT